MAHIAESTHWYDREANPAYTQTIKSGPNKGKERPTTLADARKLGLLPSVTTILKEAAKPGLENWKQEQVLWSALTATRNNGETDGEFITRIMLDSKEQAIKAAERGTQIHTWIQQGMMGWSLDNSDAVRYFQVTDKVIEQECDKRLWYTELSFAIERYGGKVDLYHPHTIILDIKTKDKPLEGSTIGIYDDHKMQLGAYRQAVSPQARCGIVFVSTVDVSAKLVWIPEDDLVQGTEMFNALLDYWYKKTKLSQ